MPNKPIYYFVYRTIAACGNDAIEPLPNSILGVTLGITAASCFPNYDVFAESADSYDETAEKCSSAPAGRRIVDH